MDKKKALEMLDEKNPLLEKYFTGLASLSTIDLNISNDSAPAELNQVFVSVPTSIIVDAVVANKKVVSIHERGVEYPLTYDNAKSGKYDYFTDRFNEIINDPRNITADGVKRLLIYKPYWGDGLIKNFIRLKPIDVISANQYTVVLGGPGAGKSTLLRYLTLILSKQYGLTKNSLDQDTWSTFFYDNQYIPFYVQLRRFVLHNNQTPKTIIQQITKESLLNFIVNSIEEKDDSRDRFASLYTTDMLENAIKNKNIIFFFDGIDEIFLGSATGQIIQKIVNVVKEIQENAKIVFSSRPESYNTWELEGFVSFELLQMDDFCKKKLIERVLATFHLRDSSKMQTTLFKLIENSGLDVEITGNPLFLSLMVVIYALTKTVPTQKSRMIDECIRFLIKRWQQKISKEHLSSNYELDQLYFALKDIAYTAIQNSKEYKRNPLIITKNEINEILDNLIRINKRDSYLFNDSNEGHKELLFNCLVESVGVITSSFKQDYYEFSHRHYQEYLVASKIVEQPNLPLLVLDLIGEAKDDKKEIFFMVIDILLDKNDYSTIWNILMCLSNSDADDGWETWYCCKTISSRDFLLLKTVHDHRSLCTKQIITRINEKANTLLQVNNNQLPIAMRIDCARYLGVINERIQNEPDLLNLGLLDMLGDKRKGVGLNEEGLPELFWCSIPAGSFEMGTSEDDAKEILEGKPGVKLEREQPSFSLSINGFEISRYPITFSQYGAFVKDGAYEKKEFWSWSSISKEWYDKIGSHKSFIASNVSNAPVVGLSWIEAASFCVWISKKTGMTIRLPYEDEWEYVAKKYYRLFSCSVSYDPNLYISNYHRLSSAAPVGICHNGIIEDPHYPCDLNGNIWEWTQTIMPMDSENLNNYINRLSDYNINLIGNNDLTIDTRMVAKGGCFLNEAFYLRSSYRGRDYIWNHISERQGFRVVKEISHE